jgi:hypothetical protein
MSVGAACSASALPCRNISPLPSPVRAPPPCPPFPCLRLRAHLHGGAPRIQVFVVHGQSIGRQPLQEPGVLGSQRKEVRGGGG